MDLARFPSDHVCQFFRDDGPLATIRWYIAPPGAKIFPGQHKFQHVNWYTEPWKATGVGEVYGQRDTYNDVNTPPTAEGQDFFGRLEDFQRGCVFDPDVHVDRDAWGLARACTPGRDPNWILMEQKSLPPVLLENGDPILTEN